MQKSLSRGIVYIFIANVINLVFNLITTFILPKYLSVDSYAAIKTYSLYVNFSGLFHFGYIDGMYLKYGGKDLLSLDKRELINNISTMRIFQTVVTAVVVIVGICLRDDIFLMFAVTILPYNMSMYYKSFFQAIGEFDRYGKILNSTTITLFICNIVLLFFVKTDRYIYYLIANALVYLGICFLLEYKASRALKVNTLAISFSILELKGNIVSGILLMLGNFASIILTSMDRWFTKFYFDNFAFASYSFAVSAETFLDVAISPISVTLYNYFCKHDDLAEIEKIRRYVMIFGAFLVSSAFVIGGILKFWLVKYVDAIKVVYILFESQLYFIIIRSVYINLYKARKRQNIYFVKLAIIIVVGFVTNLMAYFIFHNKEGFAIATMVSLLAWLILCQLDFKDVNMSISEIVYLALASITFYCVGVISNPILSFFLYIVLILTLSFLIMRKEFIELIGLALSSVRRILFRG